MAAHLYIFPMVLDKMVWFWNGQTIAFAITYHFQNQLIRNTNFKISVFLAILGPCNAQPQVKEKQKPKIKCGFIKEKYIVEKANRLEICQILILHDQIF